MATKYKTLTLNQIDWLAWAVRQAEAWQGYWAGDPDGGEEQHAYMVGEARKALTQVRRDRKELRNQFAGER